MFPKFFGRSDAADPSSPAGLAAKAEADAARDAMSAEDKAVWQAKLASAIGNDEALLSLAAEAPLLDIRYAAVQALQGEEALKTAERAFRDHDRRIHREAKLKLDTVIATREARTRATTLIEGAEALLKDATIPANRLVELDRAWSALQQPLIGADLTARYQSAADALSARVRERGEQQLTLKRWLADADRVLAYHTEECLTAIREGTPGPALAAAGEAINTALATRPSANQHAEVRAKQQALEDAKQDNEAVVARLSFLIRLTHPDTLPANAQEEWNATPATVSARLTAPIEQRFADWLQAQQSAKQSAQAEARQSQKQQSDKVRSESRAAFLTVLASAEQALSEGHLGDAIKHLGKLDELDTKSLNDKKLQARVNTLQAEVARLKGWQHWGGGRVRDDLAEAAEKLAKEATVEKLNLKLHADAINALRERWKEVDKLGGATNRELWERFDGALKTAYVPVAEQLAKLKAQRQENLAERNKLIDILDAVPSADAATPDWRTATRALEQFNIAWRKLGPIEHTVPAKAKAALLERQQKSVARLEAPLNEARQTEEARRQDLINQAKTLTADANARDSINKVRELQKQWQASAQALPLARNHETKLWAAFKAATDAVFEQRDAVGKAREATWKAERVRREELIGQLTALNTESPPETLRKTLASVEQEWRKGEVSRNDAAKLDTQYRTAREAAQKLLAGSATRGWQRICDALLKKCALVEKPNTVDLDVQLAALPVLSNTWEKALATRRAGSTSSAAESLLQLEMALDLPSPEAFASARRDLKLRAMKQAIEARAAPTTTDADVERWIAEVVASSVSANDARFTKIIAALGNRPLKLPTPKR